MPGDIRAVQAVLPELQPGTVVVVWRTTSAVDGHTTQGAIPFTYGLERGWIVLVALMAIGAWIRHYFNLRHRGRDIWLIPATSALALIVLALVIRPDDTLSQAGSGAAPAFSEVRSIVQRRCVTCHSGVSAPQGVRLETAAQIRARAAQIDEQAVVTKAMPLGNATRMTQDERDTLGRWAASR